MSLRPLQEIDPCRFEAPEIKEALERCRVSLAGLNEAVSSMEKASAFVDRMWLDEAKASSAIEGIVADNQSLRNVTEGPAAREVLRYRWSLRQGVHDVQRTGLLTVGQILAIQETLESNRAGFRALPGTVIKDGDGNVVHRPPQDFEEIKGLMRDLETFLNDDEAFPVDPLIKMALAHHQFESIHPFYDGNGRTGRIVNLLYLLKEGVLAQPALAMSSEILKRRDDYYRFLQGARRDDEWESWGLFMLSVIDRAAMNAKNEAL